MCTGMDQLDFDSPSPTDEATEKMAQLLLRGWTMLAETCTECSEVPLMRSKQGKTLCCRCSAKPTPKIPEDNTDLLSNPTLNTAKIDPYRAISQFPLNSKELEAIHSVNSQPTIRNHKSRENVTFSIEFIPIFKEFKFEPLELYVTTLLDNYTKYANTLQKDTINFELDAQILKNLETLLNIMNTIKQIKTT